MSGKKVADELAKAVTSLGEALTLYNNSVVDYLEQKAFRDACIQRFEYCLELSWKTSVKLLGSTTGAAKPAVREMARNNLISNPTLWITFVEARNSTSHYETIAKQVFVSIVAFMPEVTKLLVELRNL